MDVLYTKPRWGKRAVLLVAAAGLLAGVVSSIAAQGWLMRPEQALWEGIRPLAQKLYSPLQPAGLSPRSGMLPAEQAVMVVLAVAGSLVSLFPRRRGWLFFGIIALEYVFLQAFWVFGQGEWFWPAHQGLLRVVRADPVRLQLIPGLLVLAIEGIGLFFYYRRGAAPVDVSGGNKVRKALCAAVGRIEPGLHILDIGVKCGSGEPVDILAIDSQWRLTLIEVEDREGAGFDESLLLRHFSWVVEQEAPVRRRYGLAARTEATRPRLILLVHRTSSWAQKHQLKFLQNIPVDIAAFSLVPLSTGLEAMVWKHAFKSPAHRSEQPFWNDPVLPIGSDAREQQEVAVAEVSAEELSGLID